MNIFLKNAVMTNIQSNVVTHFPSLSLGTLFKNPNNINDPNIYVLFSGHVCSVDTINATFLTFQNKTINAKVLNVNIWIDVACAVLEDSTQINFPILTIFNKSPVLSTNQPATFFSNYQINNTTVRPITSNIRVPNYNYPQETHSFFYPDSFLLKESQGKEGYSGSPIVDTDMKIIGIVSKIVGCIGNINENFSNNLIGTKTNMFYDYLFNVTNGLITKFFTAFLNNKSILTNLSNLVLFRNSFDIIICHLGFLTRSYKDITSKNYLNLSNNVNGIVLSYRYTGINSDTYWLVNYLQKNDPEIYYFRTLLEGSELMSDYYRNKSFVLLKTLSYTDKNGNIISLDLGTESISNYYVNGDPSKSITIDYLIFGPSSIGSINMIFGPVKKITIQPLLVNDNFQGTRYTSQLPRIFTSTSKRSSSKMIINLYNLKLNYSPYYIIYSALKLSDVENFASSKTGYITEGASAVALLGTASAVKIYRYNQLLNDMLTKLGRNDELAFNIQNRIELATNSQNVDLNFSNLRNYYESKVYTNDAFEFKTNNDFIRSNIENLNPSDIKLFIKKLPKLPFKPLPEVTPGQKLGIIPEEELNEELEDDISSVISKANTTIGVGVDVGNLVPNIADLIK